MTTIYKTTKERFTLLSPTLLDESENIKFIENELFSEKDYSDFSVSVDRMLLLQPHHFDAFTTKFENGHYKGGTIRYKKDMVRLPFGAKLPAYTPPEFDAKKPPRGILTIEEVVGCPLYLLSEEEAHKAGFDDHEHMIYEMTEMEGRWYKELTPETWVSYYHFGGFDASPSKREMKNLLKIVQPPEPRR